MLIEAAIRCKHIGIPPVGHRPVEEVGKARVVQIVIDWGFKEEVDVALFKRPFRGTLFKV